MEGQRQQRILIVDNDERVLRVLEGFLANAGFDTRTALDGHVALNLLQLQDCDLVLVTDALAGDVSLEGFLTAVRRFPTPPSVILMQADPARSWDAGPYRSLGATSTVNKWRPCDVLWAANEVLFSVRASGN